MEYSDFFLVYYNDIQRNASNNSNRVVKFLKKKNLYVQLVIGDVLGILWILIIKYLSQVDRE